MLRKLRHRIYRYFSPAHDPLQQADADGEEARYKPLEWSLVRKLLRTLYPYRWTYAAAISIGLIHVLLDMAGPRFVGAIVNELTVFTRYSPAQASAASGGATRSLLWIMALWLAVIAGSIVLQRWTILLMTRAGEHVQFDFRSKLFAKLQELSMSYYDKTKLGRIISRCTSDINSLREVNVWGIWQVVANLMQVVVAATMLLLVDWRLFAAVSPLGLVLYLMNRLYLTHTGAMWQSVREGFTRVSTNLAENITGVRVVTAYNRQNPNLIVFNNLQDVNTANNVQIARVNGVYQPALSVVGFMGKAIILLYGGFLVASNPAGTLGVGAVVSAYLYWDWFMNPILGFSGFYNQILVGMASAERLFDLLEMKPDVADTANAEPLPRIEGRVKFEDVTFGYVPDKTVLHHVSFEAEPGQTFALVGATGSGKSSIISLIARFYQPQSGRVLVDGHDIRHVTGDSLHRQMGLVLQVNYLFTGTVFENIQYAKSDATEADVMQAAKDLGTHDAIMSLSQGYHSDVGERGANMSLGQRQLICFTRAYLADPRIFMLDEATSAVDTATEMLVQNSLEKLLQGRTTFIVAHRLSTIMRADCILVIDKGSVTERGTHAELLALGGRYRHLYEQFSLHNQ